jgi:hypothetical protein
MAWVSQDKKKILVAAAKKVVPKDWKVTFAVRHHSSIVATIQKCPASVLADYTAPESFKGEERRPYVNIHSLDRQFKGKTFEVLSKLHEALNTGNHDNSDIMSDYFDVGHYIDINFGRWDKECEFV